MSGMIIFLAYDLEVPYVAQANIFVDVEKLVDYTPYYYLNFNNSKYVPMKYDITGISEHYSFNTNTWECFDQKLMFITNIKTSGQCNRYHYLEKRLMCWFLLLNWYFNKFMHAYYSCVNVISFHYGSLWYVV